MRKLAVLVVAVAGCQSSGGTSLNQPYTLFADAATIAPDDAAGQPLCSDVTVLVRVTTAGDGVVQTDAEPGLMPSWQASLETASETGLLEGERVDVIGRCDGTERTLGSIMLTPTRSIVEDGPGLAITGFGAVQSLKLHFQSQVNQYVAPASYVSFAPDQGPVGGGHGGTTVAGNQGVAPPSGDVPIATSIGDDGDGYDDGSNGYDDGSDGNGSDGNSGDGSDDCGCSDGGGDDGSGSDGDNARRRHAKKNARHKRDSAAISR